MSEPTIPNALSPTEWKAGGDFRRPITSTDPWRQLFLGLNDGHDGPTVLLSAGDDEIRVSGPEAIAAVLALANAALPDDDPRKITHADADVADAIADNSGEWTDENRERLERLAAKLRAILPPPPLPPQDPADAADRLGRRMGV